ncbi:MAG TPA: hypothetical protein VLJ59_01945 [Mycobacteriales bacterium]|nr:hypothetical protein [Mycobacteriales bacterium]
MQAELPLGGLPNRVSPSRDGTREAALSAIGAPLRAHRLALPSAYDPRFQSDVRAWLTAVAEVLRPLRHPAGPVAAVQVGNEGGYGETALPIDALDYSLAGLAAFAGRRRRGQRRQGQRWRERPRQGLRRAGSRCTGWRRPAGR